MWVSEVEISEILLSLSRLCAAAVNKRPGTSKNIPDACSLEDPVDVNLVDELLSLPSPPLFLTALKLMWWSDWGRAKGKCYY